MSSNVIGPVDTSRYHCAFIQLSLADCHRPSKAGILVDKSETLWEEGAFAVILKSAFCFITF